MTPSQLTSFDILFAVIMLASTIFALMKGLAREIISLVALIAGFTLAVFYYDVPAKKLVEFCRTDSIANFLGFIIIFLGCILIGVVTSIIVNRFVKAASLKWIDRILGAIFGLLRGWVISSILVVALIAFPIRESLMARSILAPFLLGGATVVVRLAPQSLKDQFHEQYEKVLQAWNQSRDDQ